MVWSLLFLLGHVTWWVFLVRFYLFRNFRSSAMAFWTALAWTAPSNGLVVSWDDSYFHNMFLCSLICDVQEVSTWAQVLLRWYLFHLRRSCARYASVQQALVSFSHMLTVTFTGRMTTYNQQWQKGKDVTRRTVGCFECFETKPPGKKIMEPKNMFISKSYTPKNIDIENHGTSFSQIERGKIHGKSCSILHFYVQKMWIFPIVSMLRYQICLQLVPARRCVAVDRL